MSKVILGQSGALPHDPSAALYIGDTLVAAAKQEYSRRNKHINHHMPPDSPEGARA